MTQQKCFWGHGALDIHVEFCVQPQVPDGHVALGCAAESSERQNLLVMLTTLTMRGRVITRTRRAAHQRVYEHAGFAE